MGKEMKQTKEAKTEKIVKSINLAERKLTLSTGELAGQANAAVTALWGETMVLATVAAADLREELDYFPLSVEYREKFYAGGKIKGSRWVKREGRPSDEAILVARLIDRSIRPLFPTEYKKDVQVVITVLSVDAENDPMILSLIATSAALAISDIPWKGPIGGARLGYIIVDGNTLGNLVANPTEPELGYSKLNLVVASTEEAIVMIEAEGEEIEEKVVEEAISLGQKENQKIIELINEFRKEAGRPKKEVLAEEVDKKLLKKLEGEIKPRLGELMANGANLEQVREQIASKFSQEKGGETGKILEKIIKREVREKIIKEERRLDGRKWDEIRPLEIRAGVLPRTHGSAIFKRGKTQTLTVSTLGTPALEQLIESMTGEETKRYIHYYNMPPFSTGEVGRFGWPSRREIGHGALAEKALAAVIPPEDKFPYTIQVVSEILSSNGSTSMAATCGSTISLMDAGVPIRAPVAGISIGLIKTKNNKDEVLLTDITGLEDGCGDMDFKVAGTEKGITAIQLDVKIDDLSLATLKKALDTARKARIFILEKMRAVIPQPRETISQYAPKVVLLHVNPEKIGDIIGPGGRMIRRIIEETGAAIDVEDDGVVTISAPTQEAVDKARGWVEGLTAELEVGQVFKGKVKRIQPFGAFVEILPGKEGLVHISKMAQDYVRDPNEIVKIGDEVEVKLVKIDEMGRLNLSMILDERSASWRSKPAGTRGRTFRDRPGTVSFSRRR